MIDPHSQTWIEVQRLITRAIADAQERLEMPMIEERDADMARGAIVALKKLVEAATRGPNPVPPALRRIGDTLGY